MTPGATILGADFAAATCTSAPADIIVDPAGGPNSVPTLQAAVDRSTAMTSLRRVTIELAPGEHAGPVVIPRAGPALMIRGRLGAPHPVLYANIDAQMPGTEYDARFGAGFADAHPASRAIHARIAAETVIGTHHSAVLRVERDDTWLSGVAIRNTYNCDRAAAAPKGAIPDATGRYGEGQHQAVALHLAGADRLSAHDLQLTSWQDTLYLQGSGRARLTDCQIVGDVDFIFGGARALFQNCDIVTRTARAQRTWALAPCTAIDAAHGFVLQDCRFTDDGPKVGQHFLGRQWFEGVRATPYGIPTLPGYQVMIGQTSAFDGVKGTISQHTLEAVGKARLEGCSLGTHIDPAVPWDNWNGHKWSPRFRPVQRHVGDFLYFLRDWLSEQDLNYSHIDHKEEWLSIICPQDPEHS